LRETEESWGGGVRECGGDGLGLWVGQGRGCLYRPDGVLGQWAKWVSV
jgi:hypothetical protein